MAKPRNLILCITLFSLSLITTLASNPQISGVTSHEHHKNTKDSIGVYELKKGNLSIKLTNYGATVISLILPDKYGKLGDVVLGYETVKEYVNDATYFGAIVGRVANRIAGAQFTYNGVHYMLVPNEGKNIIHGGPKGFSRVIWKVDKYSPDVPSPFVTFSYYSVDGEQDTVHMKHDEVEALKAEVLEMIKRCESVIPRPTLHDLLSGDGVIFRGPFDALYVWDIYEDYLENELWSARRLRSDDDDDSD